MEPAAQWPVRAALAAAAWTASQVATDPMGHQVATPDACLAVWGAFALALSRDAAAG